MYSHCMCVHSLVQSVRVTVFHVGNISLQGFQWAIDNNRWQARASSIQWVFEVAARDMRKSEIDSETVKAVWDRISPGLLSHFDAPLSLRLIAPRALLVLNGALDERNPVEGLQDAVYLTRSAYANFPSHFDVQVRYVGCARP